MQQVNDPDVGTWNGRPGLARDCQSFEDRVESLAEEASMTSDPADARERDAFRMSSSVEDFSMMMLD
ncbi:hypothetical protein [Ensifer aridi]|uniref:hypothetical protein n=1 Tax=Ensifer aridi TaxID=1708715 RepID=UPI00111C86CB|nr:hypothetical protein [Ensifer aridi]